MIPNATAARTSRTSLSETPMDDDNWDGSRDNSAEGVRTGATGDEGGGGGASLSFSSSDCGGDETRSFPHNDDDDEDDDDDDNERGRFLRKSRREESLSRMWGWMFNWRRLGIVRGWWVFGWKD